MDDHTMDDHTDVLVIGGGPAGSIAAALLARAGLHVRLLERDRFPRYHIGESLAPSSVAILRLAGALDEVDAHGFQDKYGARFNWESDEWIVSWGASVDPAARSWQVSRQDYDHILLRNAERQGVRVAQQAAVRRIDFTDGRAASARWRDHSGAHHTASFDFLVDASGRSGILAAQQFDNRRRNPEFENVAVWGYWNGARIPPGAPTGAINVVTTPDGWWWAIPLAGDRLSLGYVTSKDRFADDRPRYASLAAYYDDKVVASHRIAPIVAQAELVSQIRAEQDYSYVADRFCGPGYTMVGDAACFLDPLLSTGVHLAQYSALLAAAAISATLHGELSEARALGFFEHAYRRAYYRLLVLTSRLYQSYDGQEGYFWQAYRLVGERQHTDNPLESFIDVIAGNSDLREAQNPTSRVLTDVLMHEAVAAQDQAHARHAPGTPHVDFTPMREVAPGPQSAIDGLYVVTEPRVGLRRSETDAAGDQAGGPQ